jgi:hypothetical protein
MCVNVCECVCVCARADADAVWRFLRDCTCCAFILTFLVALLLHRDYSHSQDAGQQRSFFVKLIGEGVFDNGGPYRAVLGAACGEEPAGPLQFLKPCPNAENGTGSNRDIMVFNPSLLSPTQISRLKLWGKFSGMVLRQDMLVSVSLPSFVWKALTGVAVDDSDLLQVDEFAMRSFAEFDACVKEVC